MILHQLPSDHNLRNIKTWLYSTRLLKYFLLTQKNNYLLEIKMYPILSLTNPRQPDYSLTRVKLWYSRRHPFIRCFVSGEDGNENIIKSVVSLLYLCRNRYWPGTAISKQLMIRQFALFHQN